MSNSAKRCCFVFASDNCYFSAAFRSYYLIQPISRTRQRERSLADLRRASAGAFSFSWARNRLSDIARNYYLRAGEFCVLTAGGIILGSSVAGDATEPSRHQHAVDLRGESTCNLLSPTFPRPLLPSPPPIASRHPRHPASLSRPPFLS